MLDATQAFEKQDLTIADLIAREGRAIVFVANKWDLVENRPGMIKDMRERLDALVAADRRRAAGRDLGADRRRHRPHRCRRCWRQRGLEQARRHLGAEPLSRECAQPPRTAGGQRAARPRALHDAGEGAAADLRAVRQPVEGAARGLSALSDERIARALSN